MNRAVRTVSALALVSVVGWAAAISSAESGNAREPVRSPVARAPRLTQSPAPSPVTGPATYPLEHRAIDASNNNEANPGWGAAGIMLRRLAPNAYDDGVSAPARPGAPSARAVSNTIFAQDQTRPNHYAYTDWMWQWGQFLDHDIDETPVTSQGEALDVAVPMGDPWFDPNSDGDRTIPLDRSAWLMDGGVRQQLNNITAYIDASNVYGSDPVRAAALRTNDGTGRLATSAGDLLPFNTQGLPNAPSSDPGFFLAGDIRANEQVGLTSTHTLFVREHNRLAGLAAAENPSWTGDEIYEHCRAIVAAEMQRITYRDFLPRLLGPGALDPYAGYDPGVDAGIANEFATCAYRVGHTMLSPTLMRFDATNTEIPAGHLPLAQAFFAPQQVIDNGIDPVLRGLACQRAQNVDACVIDSVRNMLFGPPGSGGFDLVSLNIQRGRDHGLPGYNALRTAYGMAPAATFADINPDPAMAQRLASVYATPDDVDPWVGILAEPHLPGAFVGETAYYVLRDQFTRLRDGDRFWYESYLPADLLDYVENRTLADIIRDNTDAGEELPDDVFAVTNPCAADVTTTNTNPGDGLFEIPDGEVNGADLSGFVELWLFQNPAADLNTTNALPGDPGYGSPDGTIDGADLSFFVELWLGAVQTGVCG